MPPAAKVTAIIPASRKRKAGAASVDVHITVSAPPPPPPLDAAALLAASPAAIVASAGGKLERLLAYTKELAALTAAAVKAQRLAATECCLCYEDKAGNCGDCNDALCVDHSKECANCDSALCEGCWVECNFENGCTAVVCEACVSRTVCERPDKGGCEGCRDDFDCVDCDQCACR